MSNKDFQRVLTHGYVHGHIHKHKDHTHIHGHIHNHDHEQEQLKHESAKITELSEDLSESCRDFEELADCKDILCDELDDCFFFSCDDTKRADGCLTDDECHSDSKPSCTEYCPTMTDPCVAHPHAHAASERTSASESTSASAQTSASASSTVSSLQRNTLAKGSDLENFFSEKSVDVDKAAGGAKFTPYIDSATNGTGPTTVDSDGVCYDPHCVDNTKISYDCCASPSDTVDGQADYSRPIFENLINNVSRNLLAPENSVKQESISSASESPESDTPTTEDQPRKRRKVEPDEHFHQSCFHTTIPNDMQMQSSQLMSDFDFFIQFNNFNQSQTANAALQQGSPKIPTVPALSIPGPLAKLEQENLAKLEENLLPTNNLSCQWDHCFKKISDETLTKHIMDQHISQEYPPVSIHPKQTSYQCEWNDCNYMNSDLNLLIDHLNVHKEPVDSGYDMNSGIPTLASQNVLTPRSTGKSSMSSPFELQTPRVPSPYQQQSQKSQAHHQHPHSHGPHDYHQEYPSNNYYGQHQENQINITQVKIIPKRRPLDNRQKDPNFVCHWHMGTDAEGNEITCKKTHTSEGELQEHLCNEHIGSGKSVYHCEWSGCDRHHGKEFNQRQKLLRHIHIHTNYKPCTCHICGSTFAVDSMLKQHLRTHSGEKPFSCTICGKKFATSSSLSIHNRVHTGERPLQCKWPGCDKRFSESSNLTKHMKIHTKCFTCDVCGKEFDKKPNFTKHMKSHGARVDKLEERTLVKIET